MANLYMLKNVERILAERGSNPVSVTIAYRNDENLARYGYFELAANDSVLTGFIKELISTRQAYGEDVLSKTEGEG